MKRKNRHPGDYPCAGDKERGFHCCWRGFLATRVSAFLLAAAADAVLLHRPVDTAQAPLRLSEGAIEVELAVARVG